MGLIVNWRVVKMGWNPNSGDELGVRYGKVTIPLASDQYRYQLKLGQRVEIITDPETGLAQILRETNINCEREK